MFVVITQASDRSLRYLRNKSGQRMSVTNSLEHARRYATHRNAVDALTRKRLASDVDSMWHHGWVAPLEHAAEPYYAHPQPNDGPARLAMLFPGLGSRKIVHK